MHYFSCFILMVRPKLHKLYTYVWYIYQNNIIHIQGNEYIIMAVDCE